MDRIKKDIFRSLLLVLAATLFVRFSEAFAILVREPFYAPWMLFTGFALYGVALAHGVRRLLFPYIDLKVFAEEARQSATGAGLVFLGVCLVLCAVLMLMAISSPAHAEIPTNAKKYIPILKEEAATFWPASPLPSAMAAQVEQETCISIKYPECWSPLAELKTARERGVGLGQITRTAHFDALAELKARYPTELKEWSWNTAALYDPHLQLRGLVLMDHHDYDVTLLAATEYDRLAFTLAAYNGGLGGVLSDRKLCGGTEDCDSTRWFNNVETTSMKARKAATGYGKSFFDVNREYVKNILIVRRPKYIPYMENRNGRT